MLDREQIEGRERDAPITPPDPRRGICPTCGLWALATSPNPDRAQVAALAAAPKEHQP
jgi:hypothetical protein